MRATYPTVALLLGLALAGPASATSGQVPLDPRLQFEELVTGLVVPVGMAFIGPNDILIIQKEDGRVLRVTNFQVVGEVLDVNVQWWSEQGLLGIAVDPDFINNGFVYLFFTESATGADNLDTPPAAGNRLYRYRWNGTLLVEPKLLLELPVMDGPHNGGVLAFGPDDKLYLQFADLVRGNEVFGGQLHNVADGPPPDDTGVTFRLNTDGSAPRDNPFYNHDDPDDPMNKYYAYGIRNSFGIGFDPVSGDLWQSENGPDVYDEINRIAPGMNGGHYKIWGPDARDPEGIEDLWVAPGSFYSDPEFSWYIPVAITTVAFIASRKMGCDNEHDLLVGSYGCRVVYHFELDGARESVVLQSPELADLVADNPDERCVQEQGEILFAVGPQFNSDSTTDIVNGPDGLLYFLSHSHGTLRRLSPVPGMILDADSDQVDDACDCDSTDPTAYAEPHEVPRIRLSGTTPTHLGWDPQTGTGGSGTDYDLVTGRLSDLRRDNGFARACTLAADLGPPAALDERNIAPGEGLFYLVRAGNACAAGTFGDGSTIPDPRNQLDAALPDACR